MYNTKRKTSYLSTIGRIEQRFRLRSTNLLVRLVFPQQTVRSFAETTVRLLAISERDAVLRARNPVGLPDHFYMVLGRQEIFLTCARCKVEGQDLHVKFANHEGTPFIDALTRLLSPSAPLAGLRGIDYHIDQRIQ